MIVTASCIVERLPSEPDHTPRSDRNTVERIMRAGEVLIGRYGYDAVSTRAIVREANANSAALHYHFGSKAALVQAILERRVAEVNADRLERLSALSEDFDVSDLLTTWVRPLMKRSFANGDPVIDYVRFGSAVISAGGTEGLRGIGRTIFAPHREVYLDLLARLIPDVDPSVRRLRLQLMIDASFHFLAMADDDRDRTMESADIPEETFNGALIDILAGMLSGPPTDRG